MDAQMLAFNPEAGVAEELEPKVRRVLAPNPSPMTRLRSTLYSTMQELATAHALRIRPKITSSGLWTLIFGAW